MKSEKPNPSVTEPNTETTDNKQTKQKTKDSHKSSRNKIWIWPVTVFIMVVIISLIFSMLSEWALSSAGTIIAVIVIVVFIALSIVFDMLGLAVASCNVEDFHAMAARKVKGSKQALSLVKNADKVSSVCNDVIGDVCGILSGSAGAALLANIALTAGTFKAIFVSSLIAAIIAGFTIGGKAVFKRVAITHATSITLNFAKLINFFTHKG